MFNGSERVVRSCKSHSEWYVSSSLWPLSTHIDSLESALYKNQPHKCENSYYNIYIYITQKYLVVEMLTNVEVTLIKTDCTTGHGI